MTAHAQHEQYARSKKPPLPLGRGAFAFTHRSIDAGVIRLGYRLEGGQGSRIQFQETFVFDGPVDPEVVAHPATQAALAGLHLAAGISYWKACCPAKMLVETGPIPEWEAEHWENAYTNGLGEFFFRNGINPNGLVRFPSRGHREQAENRRGGRGAFILDGGGKDTAVSMQVARASGKEAEALTVGHSRWARACAEAAGIAHVVLERRIDPQLLELNRKGAYNGHVPISMILAHISLLAAILRGKEAVIASNERGASFGNLGYHGLEVNHQWSKGLQFERMFQSWAERTIPGAPTYFSLLRPLGELGIAKSFARHPEHFDGVTSCNKNFRISGAATERWCGTCPKCVFVYAIIRPFIDDPSRERLFGRSFFADAGNIDMVARLTGKYGHKPFECVGTPEETVAALSLAAADGIESGTPVMSWFESAFPDAVERKRCTAHALEISHEHAVPAPWQDALHAYLGAR
jgi:hypothetical protein